jgi:ArsR family transcriptional regulator, cadmium/lead-responsive transcriptional repressor
MSGCCGDTDGIAFPGETFFRIMSEPVRYRLLKYLALSGEADIGTIAQSFPQDRSVISRHLKQMAEGGILRMTKEDRRVIYSVDGSAVQRNLTDISDAIRIIVKDCCTEIYQE